MNYDKCTTCGASLHSEEVAIYMKLVSRQSKDYLCLDCLATMLRCERVTIEKYIAYLKESGLCTLFRRASETVLRK